MLPVLCEPVIITSGRYTTSVIYSTRTQPTWPHAPLCFRDSNTVMLFSMECRITIWIGFSGYGSTSLEFSVPSRTGPLWQDSDVHFTGSRWENASHTQFQWWHTTCVPLGNQLILTNWSQAMSQSDRCVRRIKCCWLNQELGQWSHLRHSESPPHVPGMACLSKLELPHPSTRSAAD